MWYLELTVIFDHVTLKLMLALGSIEKSTAVSFAQGFNMCMRKCYIKKYYHSKSTSQSVNMFSSVNLCHLHSQCWVMRSVHYTVITGELKALQISRSIRDRCGSSPAPLYHHQPLVARHLPAHHALIQHTMHVYGTKHTHTQESHSFLVCLHSSQP